MTREEAIDILKNAAWLGTDKDREQTEKAVEMAISALEQSNCDDCKYKIFTNLYFHTDLEMAEQEPCETSTDEPMTMVYPTIFCDDAISREEVTAEFIKWQNEVVYAFGRDYLGVRIIQSAIDTIRQLPSVQPSRSGADMRTEDKGDYAEFVEPFLADMRGDTDADSN